MPVDPDGREDLIQIRHDVAADWASVNPVLAYGEPGWDSTNNILKVGDGSTAWNALAPVGSNADLTDLIARWVAASGSSSASLSFAEDTDNGTNVATLAAPSALGADRVITLPDATGTLITGTQADAAYAPKTPAVGSGLGTTGTIDLDMAALDGTYQTISLSGNPTFTSSNRAAGRSVTVKLIAGGAGRTITWPAWIPLSAALPTSLASGKVAVFTVVFWDTTDAAATAAYSAQP